MHAYSLPKTLGSERLDTVIAIIDALKSNNSITIDWSHVQIIEPAGLALIAIILDQSFEKNCGLVHLNVSQKIKKNHPSLTKKLTLKNTLPLPVEHYLANKCAFHICCEGGIDLRYKEILLQNFSKVLDEDMLFSIQLVFNELIQNAVDHSTSERYYVYFGIVDDEVHFGVLDMGVTLPSKMEQKYSAKDDIEYLELSLKEGVTTRRLRTGGLGLFHTFEMIKDLEGKFVFISREGQVRRYFSQRKLRHLKLKHVLHGTWVMFTFKNKA